MKGSVVWKVMAFLIAVCLMEGAFVGASADETAKALSKKVDLLWKAKVRGDWGAVYDMASSDYKKLVTRGEFVGSAGSRPKIVAFTVKEIKVLEPKKKAQDIVNYKLEWMATTFEATGEDEWLMEKGRWVLNLFPEASMKKAFPGSP